MICGIVPVGSGVAIDSGVGVGGTVAGIGVVVGVGIGMLGVVVGVTTAVGRGATDGVVVEVGGWVLVGSG